MLVGARWYGVVESGDRGGGKIGEVAELRSLWSRRQ